VIPLVLVPPGTSNLQVPRTQSEPKTTHSHTTMDKTTCTRTAPVNTPTFDKLKKLPSLTEFLSPETYIVIDASG